MLVADLLLDLVIVVEDVIYFADRGMISYVIYFFGFPAVLNIVAFYFFLLQPAPWLAAAVTLALAAATFVPVPFLHPFRVARFRTMNIALTLFAGALAVLALAADLRPATPVTAGLVLVAAYFAGAGIFRRSLARRADRA